MQALNNDVPQVLPQQKPGSFTTELIGFLMDNKKFWLLPLIVMMLVLVTLLIQAPAPSEPGI